MSSKNKIKLNFFTLKLSRFSSLDASTYIYLQENDLLIRFCYYPFFFTKKATTNEVIVPIMGAPITASMM